MHVLHTCSAAVLLQCSFRRLSLKYHPDSNTEEESKAEFSRICEAYDVLSNGRTIQHLYVSQLSSSCNQAALGTCGFNMQLPLR